MSPQSPDPAHHRPRAKTQAALKKLRKRHADLSRIVVFQSQVGRALALCLAHVAQMLIAPEVPLPIPHVSLATCQGRRWATRPHLDVDRLTSAWLIRGFIDPEARIRYTGVPDPDEVSFDTPEGAITHTVDLCTFETALRAFDLTERSLTGLAEIVHDIDLRDGKDNRRQTTGGEAVLHGWAESGRSDEQQEVNGLALFDGLYATLSDQPVGEAHAQAR